MLSIHKNGYAHTLLVLLSVAGELPVKALHLVGNERFARRLVRKMELPQRVLFEGAVISDQLRILQVSGKGDLKTVRLTRRALSILEMIHPLSLSHYMTAFYNHRFPGTHAHIWRNHRVAEALAMMMTSGIEIRQYVLPHLQKKEIKKVLDVVPSFYTSRSIKDLGGSEMNKTMFTRVVGALFTEDNVYAVYNTRDAVMRWSGLGEFKTYHHVTDIARMNAGITEFDSAILFGSDASVALQTLLESDKSQRKEMRFDSIYRHVHFVPLARQGKPLLRLFSRLGWREELQQMVFPEEMRIKGHTFMELDAMYNGTYIMNHLDCDIARLIRFHDAAKGTPDTRFEVIAYPWQVEFLKRYLLPDISIKVIDEATLTRNLHL